MRVWWARRQCESQRGSASVELAVLALPCVMLLALMASGFRVADAQHRISGVASASARQASLARDVSTAEALATDKALQELSAKALTCSPQPHVSTEYRQGWNGDGSAGLVVVRVSCSVPFADLGIPLLRGSRTLTDVAVSPIDPFRSLSGTTNSTLGAGS